jgi:hypothetical protein
MDEIFNPVEKKKGVNKVFIAAIVVALVVIAGIIGVLSLRPSMQEQQDRLLAGAHREGSPEFAELSKDIVIWTDDKTVESPTGMGTISMYITGKVRNKGTRNITVLEIQVSVVTQFNEMLQQRRMLVVPIQDAVLSPDETIPVTITLDGFSKEDDRANIRWKVTAIKAE